MKIFLAFFILFGSIYCEAFAQAFTAHGVVKDANTRKPIPFATLGVKGKNAGTVADENGLFNLVIDEGLLTREESILISCIGYEELSVPLAKFKKGTASIDLLPSTTVLKAVTIKPGKYITKVFGRTGNSTIMTANMFTERNLVNDNLGKEQAAVFSIDKHCFLKDFNMLVIFNRFQNVKFRLNIYDVKNGAPNKLIINKDILFDVTQKQGWLKVDLTKYNIYLEGYKEIAVAIQWVKSVKMDTISRSSFGVSVTPVPFHAMFFRNKSQAEWKKHSPAYVAFNITVDSYKGEIENDDVKLKPDTIELSDSVRSYLASTRFDQESATSGYGNNNKIGKFVHLTDADIYYEVYGSGEPLLLLHGNSGSIAAFYKQIPALAKYYQVIAMDTRGQGKSIDKTTAPLTYEKFAEDAKLLLDSLNLKQANIVGWSDGGNTGLIMAIQYPALVKKLVTMGAVLSPDGIEQLLLNRLQANFNRNGLTPAKAFNNEQRLLTLLLKQPHITTSKLKSIHIPVLVLAGEKDVVLRAHTSKIASGINHAELLIINRASHYAPQEMPLAFNNAVLNFLKQP
jgi:pimeloyl-ACP methyl ester carboxylesterase